jgi:hypothetical protein
MAVLRPCLGPLPGRACPDGSLTDRGRCPTCAAEHERLRGSRQARGYGADHERARRLLWARLPDLCGYGCGTWLEPAADWVAAHLVDGDPSAGWIAACRRCNERAKARGVSG